MGLMTLLVFPVPAFLALHYISGKSFSEFMDWKSFQFSSTAIGICIGVAYAFLANQLMKLPVFKTVPLRVDELVKSLDLTILDAVFLSLCAGIGEELLFRAGVQFYLGVIITSVLFVVVHGYLNPFNWRQSLYGVVVLPLSFLLGFGYEWYGLWFSIAIHTAYDFTLFVAFGNEDDEQN